jgi:hypothetical protein
MLTKEKSPSYLPATGFMVDAIKTHKDIELLVS